MPEYKRFIAYFYEYIDGKKQKSAGFAKVELRNGIWRILFRLTAGGTPVPPVKVYGFVREKDRLLGLSMGNIQPGKERTEEWAYKAGETLWRNQYSFSDLSGIWIQSGDGRSFITVWDDEAVDLSRFTEQWEERAEAPGTEIPVKPEELPGSKEEEDRESKGSKDQSRKPMNPEGSRRENREPEKSEDPYRESREPEEGEAENQEPAAPEMPGKTPDMPKMPEQKPGREKQAPGIRQPDRETGPEIPKEMPGDRGTGAEIPEEMPVIREPGTEIPEEMPVIREAGAGEMPELGEAEVRASEKTSVIGRSGTEISSDNRGNHPDQGESEAAASAASVPECGWKPGSRQVYCWSGGRGNQSCRNREWNPKEELFKKRSQLQPFGDEELISCVRIFPCDIGRMQQEGWNTGKNSFLMHGFYRYRHLMLAMTDKGKYLLGVPGILNPQEKYMANMFGFTQFKACQTREQGCPFGYWCRELVRTAR